MNDPSRQAGLQSGQFVPSTQPAATDRHQRCQDAIDGKIVKRTPTYMPGISCEVASKILGRKAHTGTGSLHYAEVLAWSKGEAAHEDFEAQLWRDLVDIHRALDVDVFRVPWRMNVKPDVQVDEHTFIFGDPDGNHSVWQYTPDTSDFGKIQDVIVTPNETALQEWVEKQEANLRASAGSPITPVKEHLHACELIGQERFVIHNGATIMVGLGAEDLMALAAEPDLVKRKLMIQAEVAVRVGSGLAASEHPKVMLGGGDLAGTEGLMYSPHSFQSIVLPAYQYAMQRLNAMGIHYVFRSDGELWAIADMLFADAKCPGYGEVDRDATMTVEAVHRRFPNLVLWGNISSRFLHQATPAQIREESRRVIGESNGSRYFHGCSNAFIKGTPPENIEAMFSVC